MRIIEPIGNYFQIRMITLPVEQVSKGGIILTPKLAERTRVGEVLAVGPGAYNSFTGSRFDHGIRVGDWVYLNQYSPVAVKLLPQDVEKDDEDTFLIGESDIFGVYMRYDEVKAAGLSSDLVKSILEKNLEFEFEKHAKFIESEKSGEN